MDEVYWFEQSAADVPAGDAWLSEPELAHIRETVTPKRRADWRLGRWTAKMCAAMYFEVGCDAASLEKVRIIPAPSGSPRLFYERDPLPASLSLSHAGGNAGAAIARAGVELGCDLETVERRSPAFEADYFSPPEWYFLARAASLAERDTVLATLWSAKESVLKAAGEGLRADARTVVVDLEPAGEVAGPWRPMQAAFRGQTYTGWFQPGRELVRTVIAAPAIAMPLPVQVARPRPQLRTA